MAQCSYCKHKSIFLGIDQHGLCKKCRPVVIAIISRHLDIIEESFGIVENTKNFKTKMGRLDTIEKSFNILQHEYITKGITINNFDSNEIINYIEEVHELRAIAVEEEVIKQTQKHMDKAKLVKTATSKVNNANKALLVLKQFQDDYGYANPYKLEEIGLFIFESQLNEIRTKAEKEEFKGNNKKALDLYLDALFFIKNENVKGQEAVIKNINDKVEVLRSKT